MQTLSSVCPICKGEIVEEQVKKAIREEQDVVILDVKAGVCKKCGEQLFDYETAQKFDQARKQLSEHKVDKLKKVGVVYSY